MKQKQEIRAIGRYIRMSPRKVQRVLNQIRGKNYRDALMILEFMPYKACEPVWQLLYSAAANAQHNFGLEKDKLVISEVRANTGPTIKRFRPRAQGQGYKIRKPTCHITLKLEQQI